MKTFLLLPLLTIVLVLNPFAQAFVLPLDTVLTKTVEQSGNSIISLEQNVVFKETTASGTRDFLIKEQWLIEGDKNLKLTATGLGELKDLVKIQYLYNNKKRIQIEGKNNIVKEVPVDFFEKFPVIKTNASYSAYLKELNISPEVRLSRASGAISFAIGTLSAESALAPQIWIDQDFFRINKIRFPSTAEVEFSDYKIYDTLHYPNTKTITWADKSVVINVTQLSTKTKFTIKDFYPKTLDLPTEINLTNKGDLGKKIEEFYSRFR